jgi:hypothetical protein
MRLQKNFWLLVSDGEICTAHGSVNPCGLVVQWGEV